MVLTRAGRATHVTLQVRVQRKPSITSKSASDWAKLVAEQLEKALPDLVVSRMAKSLRARKVLVDWSQLSLAA
jgi:DNA primase